MINTNRIISLLDFTRLQEGDSDKNVRDFCKHALDAPTSVAAVCIYPQYLTLAEGILADQGIALATVTNFPSGEQGVATICRDIETSLELGADEIDVVLPYQALKRGEIKFVADFLSACRAACPNRVLKVIIESGALNSAEIITATKLVTDNGADFVKTSTGKIAKGASLEAVRTICQTLKEYDMHPGIKISGGVRTIDNASAYLELILEFFGGDWISAQHVRIGASQLLDILLDSTSSPGEKNPY